VVAFGLRAWKMVMVLMGGHQGGGSEEEMLQDLIEIHNQVTRVCTMLRVEVNKTL
jgi:hypothetical protein